MPSPPLTVQFQIRCLPVMSNVWAADEAGLFEQCCHRCYCQGGEHTNTYHAFRATATVQSMWVAGICVITAWAVLSEEPW